MSVLVRVGSHFFVSLSFETETVETKNWPKYGLVRSKLTGVSFCSNESSSRRDVTRRRVGLDTYSFRKMSHGVSFTGNKRFVVCCRLEWTGVRRFMHKIGVLIVDDRRLGPMLTVMIDA